MNMLRTILLMGTLTALIVLLGGLLGGKAGLMIAFIVAVITNFFSYWYSAPMALSISGAQPVEREEAPELYEIVARLARRAEIPIPRIYIIPSSSPNAFATGRDPQHSAIAVTAGILQMLNEHELEGVLAHELGHVRNRDILITTMAAVLASVITMVAHWGMYLGSFDSEEDGRGGNPLFALLLVILAPIAAFFIQLAVSRSREFEADATGARICGNPNELASALEKIDQGAQLYPDRRSNPALSPLYIVKPDQGSWIANLFSTHPPIPERIKRLREMAMIGG